jgi:hypothetical protein
VLTPVRFPEQFHFEIATGVGESEKSHKSPGKQQIFRRLPRPSDRRVTGVCLCCVLPVIAGLQHEFWRLAERQFCALLFQLPPRFTRFEPLRTEPRSVPERKTRRRAKAATKGKSGS